MFLKKCCSHIVTNLIRSKPQGDGYYYFESVNEETEAEGMSSLTTGKWRELGLQVKSFWRKVSALNNCFADPQGQDQDLDQGPLQTLLRDCGSGL